MNRERNLYSRSVLLAVASAMAVSLFSASVAAQQERCARHYCSSS